MITEEAVVLAEEGFRQAEAVYEEGRLRVRALESDMKRTKKGTPERQAAVRVLMQAEKELGVSRSNKTLRYTDYLRMKCTWKEEKVPAYGLVHEAVVDACEEVKYVLFKELQGHWNATHEAEKKIVRSYRGLLEAAAEFGNPHGINTFFEEVSWARTDSIITHIEQLGDTGVNFVLRLQTTRVLGRKGFVGYALYNGSHVQIEWLCRKKTVANLGDYAFRYKRK